MTPTPFSDNDIRWIAAKFGIECFDVVRVSGGFSGAMVFQVTSRDDQPFAVRGTRKATALPQTRRRSLHRLLTWLQARDLKCLAVPLRIPNSFDSEIELSETIWQIEPWLIGQPAQQHPASSQLTSALTKLSTFYRQARSIPWEDEWFYAAYEPSPGIQRRRKIVMDLIQSEWATLYAQVLSLDPCDFQDLAVRSLNAVSRWSHWLNQSLQAIEHQDFALQPVIRDIWRPHVLFSGDECTGLIDLTAAGTDHPYLDLARLLRSWFGCETSAICDAFHEFAEMHGLPHEDRPLFVALDAAAALLSPLTWIRRGLETTRLKSTAPETGGAGSMEPESVRHSPAALERLQELTELAEAFVPCESL